MKEKRSKREKSVPRDRQKAKHTHKKRVCIPKIVSLCIFRFIRSGGMRLCVCIWLYYYSYATLYCRRHYNDCSGAADSHIRRNSFIKYQCLLVKSVKHLLLFRCCCCGYRVSCSKWLYFVDGVFRYYSKRKTFFSNTKKSI